MNKKFKLLKTIANSPSVDGVINEFSSLTAVTTPANPFTFAES